MREQPCTGPRNDWKSSAAAHLRAAGHEMPTATKKLHPRQSRWSLKLKVVSMCSVSGISLCSWKGCVHVMWLTAVCVCADNFTRVHGLNGMGTWAAALIPPQPGHICWAEFAVVPCVSRSSEGLHQDTGLQRCLPPSHTCGLQLKCNLFHKYHTC